MSDVKKTASESTHHTRGIRESTQMGDVVDVVLNQVRESHEVLRVQDRISGKAKITITEIMRKWIVIFFCMIVIVSVSGAFVPFPVNVAVGIVGGMCGVVLADRYGTVHVTRKTVEIEPSDS